jgi:hypothetical protein
MESPPNTVELSFTIPQSSVDNWILTEETEKGEKREARELMNGKVKDDNISHSATSFLTHFLLKGGTNRSCDNLILEDSDERNKIFKSCFNSIFIFSKYRIFDELSKIIKKKKNCWQLSLQTSTDKYTTHLFYISHHRFWTSTDQNKNKKRENV